MYNDLALVWKGSSCLSIVMLIHGIIMASLRGLLNAMSQLWDDRPVWLRAQRGVPDIERPTGGLAVPHNMATGRWRIGGDRLRICKFPALPIINNQALMRLSKMLLPDRPKQNLRFQTNDVLVLTRFQAKSTMAELTYWSTTGVPGIMFM